MTAQTSMQLDTQQAAASPSAAAAKMPSRADKYRGATVEDLEPPAALSLSPTDPISYALLCAFERDYTHLTVVAPTNRALLGYISIPRLKQLLETHKVTDTDPVQAAMHRFRRSRADVYRVITLETPLEELEAFFAGEASGAPQEFAVVTDAARKFVMGVATREDLEEFVRRRAV